MLRKMFGGAVAVTALGAVLLGGALSWESSQTDKGKAVVGALDWELKYHPQACSEYDFVAAGLAWGIDCAEPLLGPNGNETTVGGGAVDNDGDFMLKVKEGIGELTITHVQVDDGSCDTDNFAGSLDPMFGSTVYNPIGNIDDDDIGGHFIGRILVKDNANSDCQGSEVSYRLQVNVETVNNN